MRTITFTEFRRHASSLLAEVEEGETLIILRHSKPIAEIKPFSGDEESIPAWKQPGIKLEYPAAELSSAILAERENST